MFYLHNELRVQLYNNYSDSSRETRKITILVKRDNLNITYNDVEQLYSIDNRPSDDKIKNIYILSNITKNIKAENKINDNINNLFTNHYLSPIKPVINDFLTYHLNNYNCKLQNETRIQFFLKTYIKWNNIIWMIQKERNR